MAVDPVAVSNAPNSFFSNFKNAITLPTYEAFLTDTNKMHMVTQFSFSFLIALSVAVSFLSEGKG